MFDFRTTSKIAYFTLLATHAACLLAHGMVRKAAADHDPDLRDGFCDHIRLKHFDGSVLGRPTALVGPWARRYALLAVAYRKHPQSTSSPPPLGDI